MLNENVGKLTTYKHFLAILALKFGVLIFMFSAPAQALTGKEVLTVMKDKQRQGYVYGLVEALAYAHFLQHTPDESGMVCRMDYFYKGGVESWKTINAWFENNPDQQAYVLVYGLLNRECGK